MWFRAVVRVYLSSQLATFLVAGNGRIADHETPMGERRIDKL